MSSLTRRRKAKIKLADGKARSIQHMMCTTFWHPDRTPMSAHQFMEAMFGKLPEFFKDEAELRALWRRTTQPFTKPTILPARGLRAGLLREGMTVHRFKMLLAISGAIILAACSKDTAPSVGPSETASASQAASGGAVVYDKGNGWEPVIAADPSAPYVYAVTTLRDPVCAKSKACPNWNISFRRSDDGGATWADPTWICECKDLNWTYDPQLRSDARGNLYAAFLVGPSYDVQFTRSSDHGETWSKPVGLMPSDAPWIDHPWLTVSPDGQDVYVGYSSSGHRAWITASHDSGATWTTPVALKSVGDGYYFFESGTVAPDGTVYFFAAVYPAPKPPEPLTGLVIRSTNLGKTWKQIKVASAPKPPVAVCKGCTDANYGMLGAVASDANGNLAVVYNGRGPDAADGEQIWTTTSSDRGDSWSEPQAVSPAGSVIAAFPTIVGTGEGDFRVMWTDDRNGADTQTNWNIYVSASSDGGATWSEGKDISDGTGFEYQHPEGFDYFYGDYGDVQITSEGKTAAIWGEGLNHNGPGTTWIWVGAP